MVSSTVSMRRRQRRRTAGLAPLATVAAIVAWGLGCPYFFDRLRLGLGLGMARATTIAAVSVRNFFSGSAAEMVLVLVLIAGSLGRGSLLLSLSVLFGFCGRVCTPGSVQFSPPVNCVGVGY